MVRLPAPSAERRVPLICETFWPTAPQIDGLASTKTDGRKQKKKKKQKQERQRGQTERQVVSVGVTSFEG